MTVPEQPTGWLPPPPTPAAGQPAAGTGWQPPPPANQAMPAGWHPPLAAPSARSGRSRRRGLLLALGLVVLLGVGAAAAIGWRQLHRDRVPLSYSSHQLDHPDQTLRAAEANLRTLTAQQPSVTGHAPHCYFAQQDFGDPAERAEVSDGIYCGPIQLIGSAASRNFVHFGVSSQSAGGRIRLVPAASQPDQETVALPAHYRLVRPDGVLNLRRLPSLKPPLPPAAAKDAFVAASTVGVGPRSRQTSNSLMTGSEGGVRLVTTEPVPYFGAGADARGAAAGQQLIAFVTSYFGTTMGKLSDLDLGVSVDGSTLRRLPAADSANLYKVISVPVGAKSVDLVLHSDSYVQKISLLTGKADPGNITLLSRLRWSDPLSISKDVPIIFQTSDRSLSGTLHLKVTEADLLFFTGASGQPVPASPHDAFLHLQMSYTVDNVAAAKGSELLPKLLTFRSSTGRTVHGHELESANSRYSFIVFDVPGDCTGGTVTIGGSDARSDLQLTMPESFSFPVSFPAG